MRLHWVAGFGIALALLPAVRAFGLTTTSTALSAQSSTQACPTSGLNTTLTTLTITVTGSGGVPSGTVNIFDNASASPVQIASATLNTSGQATVSLYLNNGSHTLQAVYAGSSTYATSGSTYASASISTQCTADFTVSISNISPSGSSVMTLTAGQSGTATVTVTPSQVYVASLNTAGAPAFITVSCSGLPTLSSCTFTPESLELLPGQDAGVASTMLIQTQAQTAGAVPPAGAGHKNSPVAWAILLPGMLGLGGLAWGARRRRWLQRLSLVALVGLVATLGTTGCNPRYYYYNHGPGNPPATPSGTYTVMVAGQSSNGVTAITNTTTFQLTVQ
ncbi:MAG: Ig-like domain repeat protein [Terracidiphilus sp.]